MVEITMAAVMSVVITMALIGTYDMLARRGRLVTVALLAGCFVAELTCRPWAAVWVCQQYRQHAVELIARYAREDSAR